MRTSYRPASRPNCITSLASLKRHAERTLELFQSCLTVKYDYTSEVSNILTKIAILENEISRGEWKEREN